MIALINLIIAIAAILVSIALAWLQFSSEKKLEVVSLANEAKVKIRRVLSRASAFVAPILILLAIAISPWPPSKLNFCLILHTTFLCLWRMAQGLVVKVWRFSLDAHDDFMAWHKMHFALFETLVKSGKLSEGETAALRNEFKKISEKYAPADDGISFSNSNGNKPTH